MVLDFEYGINTGNRFLDFVDHDEDPDEFIAIQTKPEEKPKKSTKETKSVTSKKTTTTTPSATTTNVSSNTTKINKENFSGKSTNTDQRRQQSNAFSDNNNQQTRNESGRGRGFPRRGGSAGQDRPPYEGGNRGGGQQRSQRFNKFEGQQTSNETSGFDQSSDAWGGETTNDNNQSFGGYRGRGRGGPRRGNFEGGRGNYEGGRGNYEGGRGGGRGRGRGGRGYFNNRNVDESSQQQQQPQTQDSSHWQQPTESNFDNTRSQSAKTSGDAGQELDADVPVQDRSFEPDNTQRGGRGQFRSRTFRNNRHYGGDRQSQYERGTGDVSQDEYRHNRRQHDRQPRTNVSGVKAVEKKDGDGAHNWGHQTENPEEHPVPDETAETTAQPGATQKDWAQQVDEAEKQMTLDEYKKQIEAKKQAHQEKLPQFNRRTAGEGEDPNNWQNFKHLYRKKTGDESNDEELEEGSGDEEDENEEDAEEEQISGKKKVITIPLHFKPIEMPRGPAGSRGGPRRGGGRPYRDRLYRDDQTRSKSPSQQTPSSQQTGEYHNDEQQPRPYRGGARQGSGRGEYRRSYVNSARGSRGGYNRSNIDPNTPDFDNKVDFPTLAKP